MGRIRTIKPRFKKGCIPADTRVAIAERMGVGPGQQRSVGCAKCGATGTIRRWMGYRGKPIKWTTFDDLELDHIVAESKGGSHHPDNIQLLCRFCNRSKGCK